MSAPKIKTTGCMALHLENLELLLNDEPVKNPIEEIMKLLEMVNCATKVVKEALTIIDCINARINYIYNHQDEWKENFK